MPRVPRVGYAGALVASITAELRAGAEAADRVERIGPSRAHMRGRLGPIGADAWQKWPRLGPSALFERPRVPWQGRERLWSPMDAGR